MLWRLMRDNRIIYQTIEFSTYFMTLIQVHYALAVELKYVRPGMMKVKKCCCTFKIKESCTTVEFINVTPYLECKSVNVREFRLYNTAHTTKGVVTLLLLR